MPYHSQIFARKPVYMKLLKLLQDSNSPPFFTPDHFDNGILSTVKIAFIIAQKEIM